MGGANASRSSLKRDWWFFLVAALVVAADQASKLFITTNMVIGESIPESGIVRLTYVANRGGAFGLFANQTFLLALTAVIGIAAILLFYRCPLFNNWLLETALSLQLGGAMGNLIDRLRFGYVVDFIDLRVWPVFNLADSAIVVGSFTLAFSLFLIGRSQERSSLEGQQ